MKLVLAMVDVCVTVGRIHDVDVCSPQGGYLFQKCSAPERHIRTDGALEHRGKRIKHDPLNMGSVQKFVQFGNDAVLIHHPCLVPQELRRVFERSRLEAARGGCGRDRISGLEDSRGEVIEFISREQHRSPNCVGADTV